LEIRACSVQKGLSPLKCGIAPSVDSRPRVTVLRDMAAVNPFPACPITESHCGLIARKPQAGTR
jgi:hypothetical protein